MNNQERIFLMKIEVIIFKLKKKNLKNKKK